MSTAIPVRVGRYRVEELLGVGGFATVYRAVDERLGVDVAVKVLAENHSLDADVRARFVEEGRRLRRASGPHVLAVHDIGETERAQPYLVLDLADRGDLHTRSTTVREQGRCVGPDDVLAVARPLAAALGDLHRRRIVHRDLAPKNLLLRSAPPSALSLSTALVPSAVTGHGAVEAGLIGADEQLALADLGLSKDLAVASGLTVATGTSGFAPPEQREHGRTVDHRADIWAASALIVWLAIDRAPDDGGDWQRAMHAGGWSRELVRAMARGLAARPDDRYLTIDAWHEALEKALRPAIDVDASRPDGRAVARRTRSRRIAVLVGTAALAALAGAVADDVVERTFDGRTEATTALPGGGRRTVVEESGVTLTIEGPTTVEVGGSLRLTATVKGTGEWAWIGPDGVVVDSTDEFAMSASTAGHATVWLVARDGGGGLVEAHRRLTVTA